MVRGLEDVNDSGVGPADGPDVRRSTDLFDLFVLYGR